jgi:hypothetical protein
LLVLLISRILTTKPTDNNKRKDKEKKGKTLTKIRARQRGDEHMTPSTLFLFRSPVMITNQLPYFTGLDSAAIAMNEDDVVVQQRLKTKVRFLSSHNAAFPFSALSVVALFPPLIIMFLHDPPPPPPSYFI